MFLLPHEPEVEHTDLYLPPHPHWPAAILVSPVNVYTIAVILDGHEL